MSRSTRECPEHGELCGRPNWTGYCGWRIQQVENQIPDYDNALTASENRVAQLKAEIERLKGHPGSCVCIAVPGYKGEIQWEDCPYHHAAKERPLDHSIAWNCPTYWDGCNCKRDFKQAKVRAKAQALAELRDWLEAERAREVELSAALRKKAEAHGPERQRIRADGLASDSRAAALSDVIRHLSTLDQEGEGDGEKDRSKLGPYDNAHGLDR